MPNPKRPESQGPAHVRRLITVGEVATALSLTSEAVRARISRGFFPAGVIVRLGEGTVRFDVGRLEEFLSTLTTSSK